MTQVLAVKAVFRNQTVGEWRFDQDRITIGRRPGSDVLLDNLGISREHAWIGRQGSAFVYHDLGSSNGSLVNEKSANEHALADGDEIKIGKYSLHVTLAERSQLAAQRGPAPALEMETLRVDANAPLNASASSPAPAAPVRAAQPMPWIPIAIAVTAIVVVAGVVMLTR